MLLTDQSDLHRPEPKTLRHRLLHIASRITRGQRKVFLRLAEHWPWALALAIAFTPAYRRSRSRPDRQHHRETATTTLTTLTETPDPAPAHRHARQQDPKRP